MMILTKNVLLVIFALSFNFSSNAQLNIDANLAYCILQTNKTLQKTEDFQQLPRSINNGKTNWRLVNYKDWCSGFWPGILWYDYEFAKTKGLRSKADSFTRSFTQLAS